jgi:hypothetical protein
LPANVDIDMLYTEANGILKKVSHFVLKPGINSTSELRLVSDDIITVNSKIKNCSQQLIDEDDMILMSLSEVNDVKEIFYHKDIEQKYGLIWSKDFLTSTYFAQNKKVYTINKTEDDKNIYSLESENFCISNFSGYLRVKENIKYFLEPQISIKEEGNGLTITDNIGFIISFENPIVGVEMKPSILIISDPQNILCDGSNCNNIKAIFKTISEDGRKIFVEFSGIQNQVLIEGSFEGKVQ